jgi:hypothetical protein
VLIRDAPQRCVGLVAILALADRSRFTGAVPSLLRWTQRMVRAARIVWPGRPRT